MTIEKKGKTNFFFFFFFGLRGRGKERIRRDRKQNKKKRRRKLTNEPEGSRSLMAVIITKDVQVNIFDTDR